MPDTNQQPNNRQHSEGERAWHTASSDAQSADRSQGGVTGAEAFRRQAELGRETIQRMRETMTETTLKGAQALAEGQLRLVQESAEQFQEVSLKVAQVIQGATEELRTLMVPSSAANDRFDDVRQSAINLFEGIVRTNVKAGQEMARVCYPGAFIELQQRFAHECVGAFLDGSATLARTAIVAAERAARPLEQRVEQRRQHAAE
jgi:hypothetical protein